MSQIVDELLDVYNALTPSQIETADLDGMAFTIHKARDEIEFLTAANERLRAALAIYASNEVWMLNQICDVNSSNFCGQTIAKEVLDGTLVNG